MTKTLITYYSDPCTEKDHHEFKHERGKGSFKEFVLQKLQRERIYGEKSMFYAVEDRYMSGYPDIHGVFDGQTVYIELKVKGGRVSRLQAEFIKQAKQAGAIAGVAYNWADVKLIVEKAILKSYEVKYG